ncbi:5-bromo-4-chloroindolyl phosphate hydrolysis family protein [Flavonifractor sp.]|uniref:5-bromo-4-chloroindolyl phosphate hydrolysis family protein n=1 Tax=Flavonifractor sp. TaxID=2049025 RepID=UPI0025BFA076|nr:5-bromo-4-chloroindolyl phosphate hydrolysis family protein [Flavonifractor sp.]
MASYQNENRPDPGDLISWIVTIVLLVSPVWPIGLILLFRKLTRDSRRHRTSRHPYDMRREGAAPGTQGMGRQTPPAGQAYTGRSPRQGKPVNLDRGKGLTIWGIVLAVVFGIALTGFPAVAMGSGFLNALAVMSPVIGFFGGGLAMIWAGTQRTKKAKRFRKYLALIGKRESISITTLAQAMPVSVHKACDDLQDMLDSGVLEKGYLDMSTGRLILSDEGLQEEAPPAPEPEEESEKEEDTLDMTDDDAVLAAIRQLNDDIDDEMMSQKIDRIGEITGKIFAYQKQNPNRAGQLRSFLSYYLPTTLKILKAYARMEEQGVEGENIRSAKERIEGMMDKVVEGFEKQLDRLFQDDAMDIATDVQVLERMLEKDGLSGGSGMTLGG